jgi:hypothetical protein
MNLRTPQATLREELYSSQSAYEEAKKAGKEHRNARKMLMKENELLVMRLADVTFEGERAQRRWGLGPFLTVFNRKFGTFGCFFTMKWVFLL